MDHNEIADREGIVDQDRPDVDHHGRNGVDDDDGHEQREVLFDEQPPAAHGQREPQVHPAVLDGVGDDARGRVSGVEPEQDEPGEAVQLDGQEPLERGQFLDAERLHDRLWVGCEQSVEVHGGLEGGVDPDD